jgi:hypothetical protein
LASPAIPPGGSGELALDLPASAAAADALALRAVDPSGRELWQWVWPLSGIDHFRKPIAQAGTQKAVARETAQTIEIQAGDLTVQISRETGMLAGARRGPQSFSLTRGPWPAVGSAKLIGLATKTDGADVLVNATFTGDLKSVAWRVRGNGWVQCDYNYTATGPQSYCGVTFDYPETLVQSKQWLGAGPYRVWKNRLAGQTLGLWENDYNNTVTGWKEWIYPEFKGCFADVRWLELKTKEGRITAVPSQPTFVQILTPEFPTEALQKGTVVSLPQAGLGFLDAIPAIGSKFRRAGVSGPQGQPTEAMGDYSGRIDLYFGEVPVGKP